MNPLTSEAPVHVQRCSPTGAISHQADKAAGRMSRRSSLLLGALPTAAPRARQHARQVLWEWRLSVDVDTAELLVSELVTNGLKASRATGGDPLVGLRLSASNTLLLIEVWDGNTQPPAPQELDDDVPALDEEGGRGLFLVASLSSRWNWYPTRNPTGKVTWCELPVSPAPLRPDQRRAGQD